MTWATPMFAAVAAGIAVPTLLVLYFLKLRRRDLEVSTTLLWKKAVQDLQANAPFQKLRRNILLLLQLLVLLAAAAALGQPGIDASAGGGRRHIILIDRSASMSSSDADEGGAEGGLSRLEAAKRRAIREVVESLREPGLLETRGDEAMVIAFDSDAEVRQHFTSNKAQLRAAIEGIDGTDAPTALERAFKLATSYTGARKFEDQVVEGRGFVARGSDATLHVFSDGRIPDAEKVQGNVEDEVRFYPLGSDKTGNVGITALRATRAFDDPTSLEVFVGLQNTVTSPTTLDLELTIDAGSRQIKTLTLPAARRISGAVVEEGDGAGDTGDNAGDGDAGGRAGGVIAAAGGLSFTFPRAEGGVIAVRLLMPTPDALGADDVGYAVLAPAHRMRVAFVTTGNLFLRTALEGMDLDPLDIVSPTQFQMMVDGNSVRGKTLADYDVYVLDRFLPEVKGAADAAAGAGLPPGRSLVLGAIPPPPAGVIDGGAGGPAVVIDWEHSHPALRHVSLARVEIAESPRVSVPDGAPVRVMAMGPVGPLMFEARDAKSHAIVVAFDPGKSLWPLDTGFVLFVAGALQHLASDGGALAGGSVRPGETFTERLPLDATSVRVVLPDGTEKPAFPAADGSVAVGPVRKSGIYTLSWQGSAAPTDQRAGDRVRRAVAANLLDPAESDVAADGTLELANRIVAGSEASGGRGKQSLWPWFLLAALVIVLLEWFVYNRKVHI